MQQPRRWATQPKRSDVAAFRTSPNGRNLIELEPLYTQRLQSSAGPTLSVCGAEIAYRLRGDVGAGRGDGDLITGLRH
jgi:hypothetical protein